MRQYAAAAALCCSAVLAALFCRLHQQDRPDNVSEPLPPLSFSSLTCDGDSVASRRCLVTNLCFVPADDQFVFLYSAAHTRYVGVRDASDLKPLLKLNPVVDHNLFDVSLLPVDAAWAVGRHAVLHRGNFLVLEPFKPDNLMHALHDDLAPAAVTLAALCGGDAVDCAGRWRLLLRADRLPEETAALYGAVAGAPPTLTGRLAGGAVHCFERARLGLRADTLWYQYGFARPQAPLPAAGQPRLLDDFGALVRARLGVADRARPADYAVLVSRTESRRVLNERELAAALTARLGLPVRRLSLEEVGVAAAVRLVSDARLLVGVHGAALALALFLPPSAGVLELFPYGLRPDRYQPYRRLCQLRRLGYRAWANADRAATVPHPEAPADRGGLAHLPAAERRRLERLEEVPAALCCDDPAFLYRVYQDTVVDVAAAAEAAAAALGQRRPPTDQHGPLWFPGPARRVTAAADGDSRLLEWRPPLNVPAGGRGARYRVWVQQAGPATEHTVAETKLRVPADRAHCSLQLWLQTEMDGRAGPVVHRSFQLPDE